jgi:hypothetical protein
MQRRCKPRLPNNRRLCFRRGPCKVVVKKSSVEKLVEFWDASLPGYALGSREIELSRVSGIDSWGFNCGVLKSWKISIAKIRYQETSGENIAEE